MVEGKVDQLLDLLQLALNLEGNLQTFLKSCVEYGVFMQGSSANTVVPHVVNTCLYKKNMKFNGLVLLKEFIPYCSVETYSDHALSWMLQCLRVSSQNDLKVTLLSLDVLVKLLEKSDKFTEVSKETGKQIVPKFLTEFVKPKDSVQAVPKILVCLEVCMRLYSGPCESQKESILKFLINSLESEPRTVQLAANCVSLLPGLGGGGKQGITYKASWSLQHESLVFALHETLDQLFVNITEIQGNRKSEMPGHSLKIVFSTLVGKSSLGKAQRLVARFRGLAECLCAMHLKSFCVAKQIDPTSVLGVVCRGLAVTSASLSNKVSMEALALTSVLPTVHVALLHVLESFILCCGRNIVAEGHLICKLLNQVIKWSSAKTWPYAVNKPYSSVRLAAYKCLCTWLAIAQTASCVHMFAEELVPSALSDIYCKKPTVTLTMNPQTMKVGKKQLKKQLTALSKSNEDRTEKLGDLTANRTLCIQALNTLELIVNSTSVLLKPELFKMIEITVLQILTEMSGGSLDIPVPYSDADCRDHLYKLLLALCLVHDFTKYTMVLFTAGLGDLSPKVRLCCQSALSSLEKVYHPSAPSLHFPTEQKNTVMSMTAKDILNTPLSSLSNNGLLVIRIINNNVKPSDKYDKQSGKEVFENGVENADTKTEVNCCKRLKDPNETYFKKDLPCDSDVEVIDISDSDRTNRSENSDENESIYNFSDGDSVNEHNYEINEIEVETCLASSPIVGSDENDLLNGQDCLEMEGEINFRGEQDSVLENDLSDLKRVKNLVSDAELSEGLNLLEDDQPASKKQRIEESNVNGTVEDDEAMMLKDFIDTVC